PMPRASARPSARSPFLFQLPATSRFRSAISAPRAAGGQAPANGCGVPGASLDIVLHDHTGTPMLQALRTKAGSIVAKILFGLLIISFVFWGLSTRPHASH